MRTTPQNDQALSVPLKALFGLNAAGDEDWGALRALQLQPLQDKIGFRSLLDAAVVLVGASLFVGTAPLWQVGVWLVASLAFLAFADRTLRQSEIWDRKTVGRPELQRLNAIVAIKGLFWASGFALFANHGTDAQLLAFWALALLLMVHKTTIVNAVPLGAALFVGATTLGASGAFLWIGEPLLALLDGVVGAMLIVASARLAIATVRFRLAESSLHEKGETVSLLLREFEDSGADWLWQTDTGRRASHVSPRFAYALGCEPEAIEGQPFLKLVAGEAWETGNYPSALHDLAEKLKRRDSFSNLLVPVVIGGRQRWWELSASPRIGEDGSFLGFRGVGSDVTEQRESADKISHLARFDTLTGLPNRLQLTEALGMVLRDAERWNSRCGFLMIDLDRFKAINDTLGHPVGDRLLSHVSKRLQSIMGSGELCGRLGGDEFAVVLKDATDSAYVRNVATRIIQTLSRPYEIDQHTLYIGASVGSAIGPRDGRTVEMLMRSADLALYRSKDEGGGAHNVYQPQLHAHAEERRLMEMELRGALENNELSIVYQPVVSVKDHQVSGFEALLRWNSAKFGPVSPAKFVPVAEDARLIVPIGAWVLQTACKEALNWPETVKVAVNVSADQLSNGNFPDLVVKALHESGLPAWRLELEVTESVFLRDGGQASQVLDRLIAMGIHLSLDDFGTGYSSLGYLRKTQFNTIKVDRSFVQGAANNVPESLAIIRAVVAMADSLGMATTAEGVETEAELAMIEKLGCKKIQGYFFGRPMPLEDSIALFRRRQTDAA